MTTLAASNTRQAMAPGKPLLVDPASFEGVDQAVNPRARPSRGSQGAAARRVERIWRPDFFGELRNRVRAERPIGVAKSS